MTPPPASPGTESTSLHILVIEDEEAHAELIRRGFGPSSAKIRITVAPTLEKARSILALDPPALVIADWLLPDGKGIDILPDKNGRPLIPLIIMTSHGDQNLAVEMMKAGAIDYLVKSDVAFRELPHTAKRVLREWKNIQDRKRSENRFRLLLENLGAGVGYYDLAGTLILFNTTAARNMGGVPADFAGKSIGELFDSDLAHRMQERMTAALDDPGTGFYEDLVTLPTGTRWFSSGYTAVRDENGEIIGVQIVSTDITARKAAEQALRESEERFRHISSLITDFTNSCVKVPGGDFAIDWITGSTDQITGYSPGEIRDRSCWKFLVLEDDLPVFEKNVTGLAPGESARCELRIRHRDGRIIWLASFAECVTDPVNPDNLRLYGGCRDITERKRAEQSLLIANRKLNLMNMVAWHDIQNKLTGLWGYIELTKDLVSDAQVMKFLEIEGEILQVIHRQLASTKEYQEMGIQPPQWLSVEGIMRSTTISGKTSSLRVRVDVDGLEIFGDPVIERVFGHLVENSVLHGQTVTEIRVGYRETASGLVLIYEDNGTGIPESLRPGLFDKSYGKTGGFDLFFVHDLLEASGMTITETGTPGKGVRFEITVPREAFRFGKNQKEAGRSSG